MTELPAGLAASRDQLLVLSGSDVRRLVPMTDAIATARAAFTAVSRGELIQPPRVATPDGSILVMLAQGPRSADVVKIVTVRPGNAAIGLPSLHGIALALDPATGAPAAVIDGSALTALRTGAASGLATDLLAASDAACVAMIGAGAQAADQVLAVCAVRPVTKVLVASRRRSSAEELAARLRARLPGVACRAVGTPAEAVSHADVVCTATTATEPLFDVRDLRDVVHVNAVGAHSARASELGPPVLRQASVIAVDQAAAALREAGDIVQALLAGAITESDLTEIGTLCQAVPPPARGAGLTVFKSVGVAAQDWALVRVLLERAARDGGLRSLELG
jgi:ornithine cyclodeaminase/alanine dehydrogenase-like protein (mu-crystallin family)